MLKPIHDQVVSATGAFIKNGKLVKLCVELARFRFTKRFGWGALFPKRVAFWRKAKTLAATQGEAGGIVTGRRMGSRPMPHIGLRNLLSMLRIAWLVETEIGRDATGDRSRCGEIMSSFELPELLPSWANGLSHDT